jgi:hypothetical protein
MSFNVNANLFRAVAMFQSTEKTRYYLAGVQIEPHPCGGVFLVATDGHRMLVVHDKTGVIDAGEHGLIVSLDAAALKACKMDQREKNPRRVIGAAIGAPAWVATVDYDNGAPMLDTAENVHMIKDWHVDGTFPDWRRVLPRFDADTPAPAFASYNLALLSSFADAGRILSDSKNPPATAIRHNPEGPALLRFFGVEHAFGVIMPMRNDSPAVIPAFVNARPGESEAQVA